MVYKKQQNIVPKWSGGWENPFLASLSRFQTNTSVLTPVTLPAWWVKGTGSIFLPCAAHFPLSNSWNLLAVRQLGAVALCRRQGSFCMGEIVLVRIPEKKKNPFCYWAGIWRPLTGEKQKNFHKRKNYSACSQTTWTLFLSDLTAVAGLVSKGREGVAVMQGRREETSYPVQTVNTLSL